MRLARFIIGGAVLGMAAALVGCANYQTVSATDDHVTYRYDPAQVPLAELASAATDYCSQFAGSPGGGLRAVPVDEEWDGPLRVVRFNCRQTPTRSADELIKDVVKGVEKEM
jgi:hypothetical protein